MSHFLARLVQRTRGEISTVRPVLPAVTAPDPTAAAWDEQLVVREAAPLAAPRIARSDPSALTSADPARAEPRAAQDAPGDKLAPAVPVPASLPRVSVQRPARAESLEALDAHGDPSPASAGFAAPSSLARSALPGAPAASPGAPASPASPAWPETPAALRAAPASRGASTTLQRSILASAGAAASRALPSAAAPTSAAEMAAAPAPIAARMSNPIARAPAGVEMARAAHAMPADLPARPGARESIAIAATPAAMLRGEPRRVGPGLAGHAAPEGVFQEAATTVEVSIGRIEVRLPPRPPASAGAAPPSTRRPMIGLADYLRARDSGKSP